MNTSSKDNNMGKYIDGVKFFPAIYSKYKKLTRDLDIKSYSKRKELWAKPDCIYTLNLEPKHTLVQ